MLERSLCNSVARVTRSIPKQQHTFIRFTKRVKREINRMMCRECYMLGNCYRTEQECLADTAMKARIENMERCKWQENY